VNAGPALSLPRFDGPLDLLLALVRKNEIEITEIPIAEITRQYLDYLHRARELNIDLGADFIYYAALLIQIKSRSLLPTPPDLGGAEPDQREMLIRQLMDRDDVLSGARFLKQKLELAEATWSRPTSGDFEPEALPESGGLDPALNLVQILRLARQALAAARTYDLVTPADTISVAEMCRWLEDRLAVSNAPLEGTALLAEQPDAAHRNTLFLAMLEMARSSQIRIEQETGFGPVTITPLM
jgi:segregation and condensation protein A